MTVLRDAPAPIRMEAPALRRGWAGLEPVRFLVAGYFCAIFGTFAQQTFTQSTDPLRILESVEYAVAGGALTLMLWLPVPGALVGLLCLALPLYEGSTGADLPVVLAAAFLVLGRAHRKHWPILLPYLAFTVAMTITHDQTVGLIYLAGMLLAGSAGLGIRAIRHASDARTARALELRVHAAEAERAERSRLADDLQQVATEALSSIERLGRTNASGVVPLNAALDGIGERARFALDEIRHLVGVLREPDAEPAAERIPVTANQVARTLVTVADVALGIRVLLGGPPDLADVTGLGCVVAVIALVWAPRIGVVTTVGALAAALAGRADELALLFLLLTLSVVTALRRHGTLERVGVLGVQLLFCTAWATTHPEDAIGAGWRAATVVTIGWAIGLSVRHFTEGRRRELASIREASEAHARAQRIERDRLARELHDVVAHQLALVSLQVTGHGGSDDELELRQALDACTASSREASAELELLVTTMRADPASAVRAISPTAAVNALVDSLCDRGFTVEAEVDGAVDELESGLRLTVTRILNEAGTNTLRYGDPDGSCTISLVRDDLRVNVSVASDLPRVPRAHTSSSGWGLRGLIERAELQGGRVRVGPRDGKWVVEATFPATLATAPSRGVSGA